MLHAVAGPDPRDEATTGAPVGSWPPLPERLDGVTVGVVASTLTGRLDPEIRAAVEQAIPVFAAAGASLREVSIPELADEAAAWAMTIVTPEASHCFRDALDGGPDDFSPTVRERLLAGLQVTAVDYLAAREAADRFRARLRDLLREVDLLLLPTMPVVATPLEETTIAVSQGEQGMTVLNHLISPFNLTGQPALSLPCGFTAAGLPIGLQLVGRHFEDGWVLAAGHAYQLRTDWHGRRPLAAA